MMSTANKPTAWEPRSEEAHVMGGDDPLFHRKTSPIRTCMAPQLLRIERAWPPHESACWV